MPEMILSKVHRCRYCGREMCCAPLNYEQNPFCTVCLSERINKAKPRGGVRWKTEGHYVIPEASGKRRSDERKRRQG
jgi:hypothetical protein